MGYHRGQHIPDNNCQVGDVGPGGRAHAYEKLFRGDNHENLVWVTVDRGHAYGRLRRG